MIAVALENESRLLRFDRHRRAEFVDLLRLLVHLVADSSESQREHETRAEKDGDQNGVSSIGPSSASPWVARSACFSSR